MQHFTIVQFYVTTLLQNDYVFPWFLQALLSFKFSDRVLFSVRA